MKRFSISLIAVFLVSGCANLTPLPAAKYPSSSESSINAFSVPNSVGRVYYSIGKVTGGMYEVDLKYPHNVYVGSTIVGRVNVQETLVFDLKPGDYVLGFSTKEEGPEKTLNVKVLGGDVIALRGDLRLGTTGFGLIGAAVNPGGPELLRIDKSALRQPLNPVVPQSCPSSMCVTPLVGASANVVTPQILKGADRLNDLNDLRKRGLINNADYEAKKAAILKEM